MWLLFIKFWFSLQRTLDNKMKTRKLSTEERSLLSVVTLISALALPVFRVVAWFYFHHFPHRAAEEKEL